MHEKFEDIILPSDHCSKEVYGQPLPRFTLLMNPVLVSL